MHRPQDDCFNDSRNMKMKDEDAHQENATLETIYLKWELLLLFLFITKWQTKGGKIEFLWEVVRLSVGIRSAGVLKTIYVELHSFPPQMVWPLNTLRLQLSTDF
jgi:hypothetical protein